MVWICIYQCIKFTFLWLSWMGLSEQYNSAKFFLCHSYSYNSYNNSYLSNCDRKYYLDFFCIELIMVNVTIILIVSIIYFRSFCASTTLQSTMQLRVWKLEMILIHSWLFLSLILCLQPTKQNAESRWNQIKLFDNLRLGLLLWY